MKKYKIYRCYEGACIFDKEAYLTDKEYLQLKNSGDYAVE